MSMKSVSLFFSMLFVALSLVAAKRDAAQLPEIGYWQQDAVGLPSFVFTGKLPCVSLMPNGKAASVPNDPWFLLGNYRLTLFTHASGSYELITGEREWGRLNQGDKINSGANAATIDILDVKGNVKSSTSLVGMNTIAADPKICRKEFGCGFAKYTYQTDGLSVDRLLSVSPSTSFDNGISAFLLQVKIQNTTSRQQIVRYTESVLAHYVSTMYQRQANKPVSFQNQYDVDKDARTVRCDFKSTASDPLMIPSIEKMSMYDGYPPSLFIKAVCDGTVAYDKMGNLSAMSQIVLKKGETKTLTFIIGYSFDHSYSAINSMSESLLAQMSNDPMTAKNLTQWPFANLWKKQLPELPEEKDATLRQEMCWHAYNLEAMATYSSYYKETKIPQGTIYDYYWGMHASARDNFQHALPLVYYNPQLAKSIMRYMAKRTTPTGEIRLIEYGYGYADNMVYCTSDQQLFFFQLLSEYLRVTGDIDFLNEEVLFFPFERGMKTTMFDVAEKCFTFLQYNIGTGSHGLVRLLNSDWNDNVYVAKKAAYNNVIFSGESMMNTTMAISILQNLLPSMERYSQNGKFKEQAKVLVASMKLYEQVVDSAFLKDLGNRSFPRRMYFAGDPIGDNNMFLEPLGYMLQIKDLSLERKQALYAEMQKRIYAGEKLGARQQQTPEFEAYGLENGSRENGGFWYSLNGPVIAGMKDVDKAEAWRLFRNMTFANYSKQFPHYWTSYWSASDNEESSMMGPQEGLADQSLDYYEIPVYCAHPHAWLLYCYYKLKE